MTSTPNSPRAPSDLFKAPFNPFNAQHSLRNDCNKCGHFCICHLDPKEKHRRDMQQSGTHFHIVLRQPEAEFKEEIFKTIERLHSEGFITYAFAGEELKDDQYHIHIAIGLSRNQRTQTVINKLRFFRNGQKKGYQSFYCKPIYQDSTPHDNYIYCTKNGVIYSLGEIPEQPKGRTREKKRKARDEECIQLAKEQKWDEIAERYPGYWIRNGARLKGLYMRQGPPDDQGLHHEQHLWLHGDSGTGKTSIVEYLYPAHFRKRADGDWLGWDSTYGPHKVVHLNDMDMQALKTLGIQHLKELCDPQGFNANVKYAGGEIINPTKVIVTSQFSIDQCFAPGTMGIEQQKSALHRRFREISISDFLAEQNLVLCSPEEVQFSKDTGLWNAFGYQCMFKPKEFINDKDYAWLKHATTNIHQRTRKDSIETLPTELFSDEDDYRKELIEVVDLVSD